MVFVFFAMFLPPIFATVTPALAHPVARRLCLTDGVSNRQITLKHIERCGRFYSDASDRVQLYPATTGRSCPSCWLREVVDAPG